MGIALFSFFRSLFRSRTALHRPAASAVSGQRDRRPACKPLRVVRAEGRMVISGRLADVCAELDRLAALEAAQALAVAPAR